MAFVVDVFLSSTFEDLKKYTDAVYARLNKHEMFRCIHQRDFGARDASAVNYCRERVLKAELYVGVLGMRRGWEPKGDSKKRSITEMEHDWAREFGKPRFLYVTPPSFSVPGDKPEPIVMHKRQLAFRKNVMGEGERVVSQSGFESPELLAVEIESKLVLHVATSGLIKRFQSDSLAQGPRSQDEQRPAIAAAVERLAVDDDLDLLALAKNPRNVDMADLERKLTGRAERHEAESRSALITSSEYWRHIGALAFLHNTQKALAAYEKAVTLDPLDPEGWRNLGELHHRLGNLDKAEEMQREALTLYEKLGRKEGMASTYVNLGKIHQTRGDLDKAEHMQREALTLYEKLGRKEGMASAYGNLAIIHHIRGDLNEAEEMHRKGLTLYEELSQKEGMASVYGNLGLLHWARGDLDKAEEMHLKSLKLEEELDRKEGMAADYGNLGIIHRARGNLEKAEEMQRKALVLHEELGAKDGMARTQVNLGNLYWNRDDLDQAEEMYRKGLALYKELGNKEGMAITSCNLVNIYQNRGDKASTCDFLRQARGLYREMGLPDKVAEVEEELKLNECGDA